MSPIPLMVFGEGVLTPPEPTAAPAATPAARPGDAFLDGLAREQSRYLQAVCHVQSLLAGYEGELPRVAAEQARLARNFLDAQRGLLRQRAETDAEVSRISTQAAREVANLRAVARRAALIVEGGLAAEPGASREQLPALARLVETTHVADAEKSERELRQLLDRWWMRERDDGRAAVDDAGARAAIAVHEARLEAEMWQPPSVARRFDTPTEAWPAPTAPQVVEPVEATGPVLEPVAAPAAEPVETTGSMLEPVALQVVEPVETTGAVLGTLARPDVALAVLLDELYSLLAEPESGSDTVEFDEPVLPAAAHLAAPGVAALEAGEEAFAKFWHGVRPAHRRSLAGLLVTQVGLPAVSVLAALTLVLAIIG